MFLESISASGHLLWIADPEFKKIHEAIQFQFDRYWLMSDISRGFGPISSGN